MLINILFILFISTISFSSIFIILSKNPIHSIFSFIILFANVTGLLLLLGADLLAMFLLIVYMGAISVLFLFIIMLLNIKILEINKSYWNYSITGFFLILIFLVQLLMMLLNNSSSLNVEEINLISNSKDTVLIYNSPEDKLLNNYVDWSTIAFFKSNILIIGQLLYTYYSLSFIVLSFILLLAMVSAIILTLNPILYSKKQLIYKQSSRKLVNSIKILKKAKK